MDNLHIAARLFHCSQFILQDDIIRLYGTVQHCELTAFHFTVGNFPCHAHEWSNTGPACQSDDLPGIAQRFPVEGAERQCTVKHITLVHIFKHVIWHKIRHITADGNLKERLFGPRLIGRRGNGIRP